MMIKTGIWFTIHCTKDDPAWNGTEGVRTGLIPDAKQLTATKTGDLWGTK
jgi:hypothetical protein